MSGDISVLGHLGSVDGKGVVCVEDRFEAEIDQLWSALTDPRRLPGWFGEVDGSPRKGEEFRVRIALSGERVARVDVCEPPHRIVVAMRDPDPQPGQPEQTIIKVELTVDGGSTRLTWEESGLPLTLLPAYGAGIQIHVERLADYSSGRKLRDAEVRWAELFPAYEALTT